jgi:hypothetical protein
VVSQKKGPSRCINDISRGVGIQEVGHISSARKAQDADLYAQYLYAQYR